MPIFPSSLSPLFAATARSVGLSALVQVVVVAVFCALAVLTLIRALFATRGTTLFAPLAWALGSFLFLVAMLNFVQSGSIAENRLDKWLLIAATSTFCPIVALLGAKRPQNRAWQLIVLSFWGIAALPAIQALITHPGEPLELHALWQWFFVVLILMGFLNFTSTPFALASFAVAGSQIVLMWKWLPWSGTYAFGCPRIGIFMICGSILLTWLVACLRRRALNNSGAATGAGWPRVWLDFRDFYGLVWSRRVMQRVESQTNSPVDWPDWYDLRRVAAADPSETAIGSDAIGSSEDANRLSAAEPALRSLLRRFVSRAWIDKRLKGEV